MNVIRQLLLVTPLFLFPCVSVAAHEPSVIDAVVASVDGAPILVSEVRTRLNDAAKMPIDELVKREDWKPRVDELILERVLQSEASNHHISVGEDEIDRYIKEVAERNGMSVEELTSAIAREYPSREAYLERVRMEILKSKLVGQFVQGGVSVSDAEIDAALERLPKSSTEGARVSRLRQIVIAKGTDAEAAQERISKVEAALDSGESFSDVAKQYSEGPAAADGGLLGELSESALEPVLAEAVAKVDVGERTPPIESGFGYHILLVENRTSVAGRDTPSRDSVRQALEAKKLDERVAQFLREDLFREHTIERRL